jgi:hypothetical protein
MHKRLKYGIWQILGMYHVTTNYCLIAEHKYKGISAFAIDMYTAWSKDARDGYFPGCDTEEAFTAYEYFHNLRWRPWTWHRPFYGTLCVERKKFAYTANPAW